MTSCRVNHIRVLYRTVFDGSAHAAGAVRTTARRRRRAASRNNSVASLYLVPDAAAQPRK